MSLPYLRQMNPVPQLLGETRNLTKKPNSSLGSPSRFWFMLLCENWLGRGTLKNGSRVHVPRQVLHCWGKKKQVACRDLGLVHAKSVLPIPLCQESFWFFFMISEEYRGFPGGIRHSGPYMAALWLACRRGMTRCILIRKEWLLGLPPSRTLNLQVGEGTNTEWFRSGKNSGHFYIRPRHWHTWKIHARLKGLVHHLLILSKAVAGEYDWPV